MILETRKILRNTRDGKKKHRVEWLRKCDQCGHEKWLTEHYKAFHAPTHMCKTCSNRAHSAKRRGRPSPFKGKQRPDSERKLGSRYVNQFGYEQEYVGPNYPGHRAKYYPVHKRTVEDSIGRKWQRGEVIHHIDGNKLNNSLENLFLCSSMSAHRKLHRQLEQLAFRLVEESHIQFDQMSGQYVYAPPGSDFRLESGEFRGSLTQLMADTVILSQASQEEGATTIPQGSRN